MDEAMMTAEKQTMCGRHGRQGIGLVCIHVALALDSREEVGFFWGDDTDTARPDAWCGKCESTLRSMGPQRSSEWFKQSDFKILCAACWDEAKNLLYLE